MLTVLPRNIRADFFLGGWRGALGGAWGPGLTDHVFPYTETGTEMKWLVRYPAGLFYNCDLSVLFGGSCRVLRGLIAREFFNFERVASFVLAAAGLCMQLTAFCKSKL